MADLTNVETPRAGDGFRLNRAHVLLGVLAAAFVFAFFNGLENLLQRWGEQQELSHGYFLPLIAGWMLWSRRDALTQSLGRPAALGLAGVAVSAIVLVLSEITVTSLMIFQHGAMLLLFASLTLALGGWAFFWLSLLPIAYLAFMVPPPYWVITILSQQFQFWSSQLGVWMIERMDIPVLLSGNIIDLGDYKLQVAEACSGLRYLFPFLSLGFLAAYLFNAPLWQRAVVFLSTIPITILMNSFRIALTGVMVQQFGASHAEGLTHFFEGWVVFLLCMALLFAVIAGLARLSGRKDLGELLVMPEIAPKPAAAAWNAAAFTRNLALSVAALVGAGAYVHFGASNVLKVPVRANLDTLPYELEGWRSERQELSTATLEVLGADDHIVANLMSPQGEYFNLYVNYLDMQRHGHSWHSPRQCIPGGGWQIIQHDIVPTTAADGQAYHFNRIIIENRGARQLLYYWYDQRGRKIANEFVMKLLLVYDAMTLRRTDGAMIRIITPISRAEDVEEADARLLDFMRTLEPKLPAYVPPADAETQGEFDPNRYY